jgi:hypothetical protein
MQNKANLPDFQMNVTCAKTNNLQQKTWDNEPIKQTQTKPIYGEPACTELSRSVEPTKPNERREVARLNTKIDCRVGRKAASSQ